MRPSAAVFLPLTLSVLNGIAGDRPGSCALDVAARRAEHLAGDAWRTLLGGCDRNRRTEFTTGLRRLSLAVGVFVGDDWSDGMCSGHRDRITRYQWWVEEAFADGSGAEFAEAFARYDEALARTVLGSGSARDGRPARDSGSARDGRFARETGTGRKAGTGAVGGRAGFGDGGVGVATGAVGAVGAVGTTGAVGTADSHGGPGRPTAVTVGASGTMAEWARQARAATTRATHRATSPLRWATSRHATSSSRWSRHSRSAG